MKKVILTVSGALLLVLLSFRPGVQTFWTFDKTNSKLGYMVSHISVTDVTGYFKNFDAKLTSTGDDFANAEAEMKADAGSMDSDHPRLDKDIQSPKYLDVKKFPSIAFKGKSFKKESSGNYKVSGDLTIKGITKPIVLDVVCQTDNSVAGKKNKVTFKIKGKIKRSDFGVGTSMPAAVIGDDVLIFAEAHFSKSESAGVAGK